MLLISVWWLFGDNGFDILLYDTYYIIAPRYLSLLLLSFLPAEAVIHFLTRRFRQWRWLQYVHVYGVLIFVVTALVLFSSFFISAPDGGNNVYARYYNSGASSGSWAPLLILLLAILALVLAHIAFVINLVAGFIRGQKAPL